ncbi:MAG: enoyl-CoA hydratase/isomerase family protein [Hyphomicrobiaceae bacterium]|nr:enoyl-CoA hydratase/isomerase family protein [Hyphomicrobiaceae bacterium]
MTEVALTLERQGAAAVATLCRAARRNAVSQEMQRRLAGWYPTLARDPGVYAVVVRSALADVLSVGGDVRELVELAASDPAAARRGLAGELSLCWLIECFSKPSVALIDGAVMGTGVGLTLYGTHRVGGEGYRFQMPETAIGWFPDCGVAHTFARMPHGIGLYLGMTGDSVGPADAYALGLLTHCIPRSEHPAIVAHLAAADPVDPVLDMRHAPPAEGPLGAAAQRIARYFDTRSPAETAARLARPANGDEDWAAATLTTLRARSPLAIALTHRAIREAARLDIRQTLIQDFRLAHRLAVSPDFREGVRAHLVEKDRSPRWQHASIADVPAALVDAHFAPLGDEDLTLPTRAAMQAARV